MTTPDERAAAEKIVHDWVAYWEWDELGEGPKGDMIARITDLLATHARRLEEARAALERAYGECTWEFDQRGSWGPLSNEAVKMLGDALARLTPPPEPPR